MPRRVPRPMLLLALLLASLPAAAGLPEGSEASPEEVRALVRRVLANLEATRAALREHERVELVTLPRDERQARVETDRVVPVGFEVRRLPLERKGRPVEAGDYERQVRRVATELGRLAAKGAPAPSAGERQIRELLGEVERAFVFRFAGREARDGRRLVALALEADPGYRPRTLLQRLLASLCATVWIDEETEELALVEGEAVRGLSIGAGILGKVDAGSWCLLERAPVADGLWLPIRIESHIEGRKLLFDFRIDSMRRIVSYRRVGAPADLLAGLERELGERALAPGPARRSADVPLPVLAAR